MTKVIHNKQKGQTERLLKCIPYLLAVILWCILVFKEQFFLKKVEDLSVFLYDKLFLAENLDIPGGFLGLAGSFLTQFLHLPWLGALIWVVLLLSAYFLTVRAFRIPDQYRVLALIPVALMVIADMALGYGIFLMREQDHFFGPLLGYMGAIIPVLAIRNIKTVGGRILLLALWTAAGFYLLGTYAFVGTLSAVCSILTDKDTLRKERITVFIAGIALILIIPLITYNFFTSYRMADSWILGLPTISNDEWTHAMRAPYLLSILCLILLSLTSGLLSAKTLKPGGSLIFQCSVYLISIAAVWGFWFKDDNFHTELAMSDAVDSFDWKRTVDIFRDAAKAHSESDAKAYAERTKKLEGAHSSDEISEIINRYKNRFFEPTRIMVMYRDLALLKSNRALDEAFTMKDGSRLPKAHCQVPISWQAGKQIYFQYGLVNMSYRWCLEDVIEHYWSYGTLKYMAMHSTIMQETEFAYKYLNKLEKTLFYRKWAKEQLALSCDEKKMAASEPYKSILPYMCFDDRMTNDMVKSETFVINHFLDAEPSNPSPEYDRAALLLAMRIQDIPRFWARFIMYVNSNKPEKLPRGVQEAALLYSSLEKNNIDLPYDKTVTDSYEAFNNYVKSHPIRNMEESAYPYSQKFGKTFYYFYYFVRNLQTY
ncbi:MAG: sulfite exporter TauE/SafE family protein [Bacteroidaceae bacterium]|nr:sulfite exporter TauE/SafE family protein [Bacteroidaceae bacterium]